MNADGSGQDRLNVRKGKLGWGTISPIGGQIAFAADRENDPIRLFDIYAVELVSGDERLVTTRPKNDTQPSFSNNAQKICFVSESDGNQEIYIVDNLGNASTRLTRNNSTDINPTFSFDGTKLVFSSNRGGKFSIYELSIRG